VTHEYNTVGSHLVTVTATNSVSVLTATTTVQVIHIALTISASGNGNDMVLSWLDILGVAEYQIWRSTEPYFTPGDAGSSQIGSLTGPFTEPTITYTDTTAAIYDIVTNHYYMIRAVDGGGNVLEESNQVGEFDYELRETATTDFSWISLPLDIPNLTRASDLANYIESHSNGSVTIQTISRWNPIAQSTDIYYHQSDFGDFDISIQRPYRVEADITSGDTVAWSQIGSLPDRDSASFALVETATTDFAWIMLPLDKANINQASDLAHEIESNSSGSITVQSISRWNGIAQSADIYYHQSDTGHFALQEGYPYRIEVDISGGSSVNWPQ
jgi:hypothetical protein